MTSNNKCRTCIYWEPHPNSSDDLVGICQRVNIAEVDLFDDEVLHTGIKMFIMDETHQFKREMTDEFVAMDFYDCPGIFMTGCDFGCVHHEEKSPK